MEFRIDWMEGEERGDPTDRRIARLTGLAVTAFGRQDQAQRWLRRPLREFGELSPLEMMESEAGARQVEAILLARVRSGA